MTSRHHVAPNARPPRFLSQSQRLANALKALRAAQTHVRLAGSLHKSGERLGWLLDATFRGLSLEESELCAALELAIDAEAKGVRRG